MIWLAGGLWSNSIAILSGAFIAAADVMGSIFAILAMRLGKSSASTNFTYGWQRAQVIGTTVSVATIWVLSAWLLALSVKRFFDDDKIESNRMLFMSLFVIPLEFMRIVVERIGREPVQEFVLGGGTAAPH